MSFDSLKHTNCLLICCFYLAETTDTCTCKRDVAGFTWPRCSDMLLSMRKDCIIHVAMFSKVLLLKELKHLLWQLPSINLLLVCCSWMLCVHVLLTGLLVRHENRKLQSLFRTTRRVFFVHFCLQVQRQNCVHCFCFIHYE